MKNFNTLSEREILALAISLEEEDERVYADFAEGLKQDFPASAGIRCHARRRIGPPAKTYRALSAKVWRAYPAHSQAGRERFCAAEAAVAGTATGPRVSPKAGQRNRSGSPAIL
jgi:hypothetical protein